MTDKPTTITAGQLAAEWGTKWKPLVDAGEVIIGGDDWEVENISIGMVNAKYSNLNFAHPYSASIEYQVCWLKDTPQPEPQPEAGGDDDLLGCDHEDTQFLRSSSGMGNRELVRVCKRCGEIMVSGVKDGVGFNIQFHVDDPETVKLISKWSAYVWKDYPDMYPKTVKALEEQLASQQRELDDLSKRNERLVAALEFYGNADNWRNELVGRTMKPSAVELDIGEKAREVLKGE